MTEQIDFKFRAFVSYSSKDRLAGTKFQRDLERYKIPRAMRGRVTSAGVVPKRISPIFRDRSDLEASEDLGQRIGAALVASRSLIVLCSPHSARSRWVNEEIRTFKRLGRDLQIVPVIVDGDPAIFDPVSAPNGAFPPALLQRLDADGSPTGELTPEPFAPDLREMQPDGSGGDGSEYVKLKVVARLLDVSLGELTQRQREVERRERRVIQGVAGGMFVLAVAATVGGWLAWRQTIEANARLDQTIDMAARQVGTAGQYESRYGVSSAVIKEMLRSAQQDFSGLTTDASASPRLGLHAARLGLSFAEAYEDAGDRDGAHARALVDAEKQLSRLSSRQWSLMEHLGLSTAPSAEDIARARLRLLAAKARQATDGGELEKALFWLQARLELAGVWARSTGKSEWRREAALTLLRQGNVHYEAGQPELTIAAYRAGVAAVERVLEESDLASYREDLLRGVTDLAQVLSESGEHRDALEQQGRAEQIVRKLVVERPQDTETQLSMVMVLTRLGDAMLNISGNQAGAGAKYIEAEGLARKLTASDPQRVDWRRALYIVLERLGSARFQLGEIGSAETAFKEALDIAEGFVRLAPGDPRRLYDAGVMQERMGQLRMAQAQAAATLLERTGLFSQASEMLERLVATREQARRNGGSDGKIQAYHLAVALLTLGEVQTNLPGREDEGLGLLARAQALLEDLTQEVDPRLEWYRTLAAVHVKRASHHMQSPDGNRPAIAELERALAIIRDLRQREPDNQRFPQDQAELEQQVAKLRVQ